MKHYLLPVVVSLVFTACNDSKTDSTQQKTMSANSTVVEQAVTKVEEKQPEIKEIEPAPQTTQSTAKVEMNGEAIFGKCKSCHGNSGEKHALGASKIIQGWDAAKTEAALKGYQKGTYGGSMKNVMAAQAKSLSNEEIKKVAIYIHSL